MKVLIDTNVILDDYGDRPDVLDPAELIERMKTATI